MLSSVLSDGSPHPSLSFLIHTLVNTQMNTENLQISNVFSLSVCSFFFSLVLYPENSTILILPQSHLPPPSSSSLLGSALYKPSNFRMAASWVIRRLTLFLSCDSYHFPLFSYIQCLTNHCFIYFAHFLAVSNGRINIVSIIPY